MRITRPFDRSSKREKDLRGPRVTLRPLVPSDFPAWSEVRQRCGEWLTKWEPVSPQIAIDITRDKRQFDYRCTVRDREWQLGAGYGFGLFVDHGERFVGELNVSGVHRGPLQTCAAGYWIDRDYAGKGLMPEAVALTLRFVFEEAALHRVEIPIVPRNTASRRVVEKLQLRDEGTALRYLEIDGVWEDHMRFAITVEEWNERREWFAREWLV